MSNTALRRLARQPNAGIALKGYVDFMNYVVPGLMTEREVIARILKATSIAETKALAAAMQGIAAARRRSPQ